MPWVSALVRSARAVGFRCAVGPVCGLRGGGVVLAQSRASRLPVAWTADRHGLLPYLRGPLRRSADTDHLGVLPLHPARGYATYVAGSFHRGRRIGGVHADCAPDRNRRSLADSAAGRDGRFRHGITEEGTPGPARRGGETGRHVSRGGRYRP